MIDIKALEEDLHDIIEPLVISADANAILIIEPNNDVSPTTSYATLKHVSFTPEGITEIGNVGSDGNVQVKAQYIVNFKFESFGLNSKNIINSIHFAILNNPLTHDSLVAINLFQFNTPIITDIPVYVNTAWEERSQTTISFHFAHEETVQISFINQATLDGTYKDIAGTTVLTTSQTIIST